MAAVNPSSKGTLSVALVNLKKKKLILKDRITAIEDRLLPDIIA